jgi:hypothetical protein
MGNEGLCVCGVGCSRCRGQGAGRGGVWGAKEEMVGKRAKSTKMVKGGREQGHLSVNNHKQLPSVALPRWRSRVLHEWSSEMRMLFGATQMTAEKKSTRM